MITHSLTPLYVLPPPRPEQAPAPTPAAMPVEASSLKAAAPSVMARQRLRLETQLESRTEELQANRDKLVALQQQLKESQVSSRLLLCLKWITVALLHRPCLHQAQLQALSRTLCNASATETPWPVQC